MKYLNCYRFTLNTGTTTLVKKHNSRGQFSVIYTAVCVYTTTASSVTLKISDPIVRTSVQTILVPYPYNNTSSG